MKHRNALFVCLIVDDDPDEVEIIRQALRMHSRDAEFEVIVASSLADAFAVLKRRKVQLTLLDLNLPDSQGFSTFEKFQDMHFEQPVVVVTGHEDEDLALRAIRMGAQDYIVKGLYRPELTARAVRFAIERHDIMVSHWGRSMEDELTSLYNRRGFLDYATKQLRLSVRDEKDLVLLYIDLDNMKHVNDAYGHDAGDQLLVDVAELLRVSLRETDLIARIGGDEFVALALGAAPEYTSLIVTRLLRNIQDYNIAKARPYSMSLSLGLASFDPRNPISLEELMKRADQAMYMDKRSHKSSRK